MRGSLPRPFAAAAILAALTLSGCSADTSTTVDPAAATAHPHKHGEATQSVSLDQGWAKAAAGMSGVFGTLYNHTDHDLTLVSATSDVADMVQLHESVTSGTETTMREVESGFALPADGSIDLAPGGDHIMLMDLAAELLPGDEVPLTLTFDDESTLHVTVLVKDFGGAQENYAGNSDDAHAEH